MKDLILITAYCPDDERENILRNLVTFFLDYKNQFEVMVVSHTVLPIDIQKKVEYFVFDKKNEILTDWDLLNQPWFMPGGDRKILSSFLTKKNTQLAIWRMMIIGFSMAKNLGYSKIHHIEYDCKISEVSEFVENSWLLNEYNSVVYMDRKEGIAEIMFGSFQSYFIPKLNPLLTKLNEEEIKHLIRNSQTKSPEWMLFNLIEQSGNFYMKDRKVLEEKGNKFGTINSQNSSQNPWSIPFYDQLTDSVNFITWNTTNADGIECKVIVNENNYIHIPKQCLSCWTIKNLGKIEDINSILVIENDKIRDTFYLNSDHDREVFKKMSYRVKND
jgi:hypothetical protein